MEAAERQAEERNAALALFAKQAEQQAAKIALNRWVAAARPASPSPPSSASTASWAQLPHRPRLQRQHRRPDPVGRQRHRHLCRATTVPTATRPWSPSMTAPRSGTATRTPIGVSVGDVVQAGEVIGEVGTTGNVHRLAPPPRGAAPVAATRSTRTPRSSCTARLNDQRLPEPSVGDRAGRAASDPALARRASELEKLRRVAAPTVRGCPRASPLGRSAAAGA